MGIKRIPRFSFPEEYPEKIDVEARRLLQILPPYDPGAGGVSAECKRHADIFHKELAKFTLWALKSKSTITLIHE